MAQAAQAAQAAISNIKNELSNWLTSLGAGQVSAEFFELIKGIGEAKSKQVRYPFHRQFSMVYHFDRGD